MIQSTRAISNMRYLEFHAISSNIIEGIKAVFVLFFLTIKDGSNKLVKVRMYVRTFTNLLGPSKYTNLLVPQINNKF